MAHRYDVEFTDTFGGEANYSWVKRETITVPELTHFGYDGSSGYSRANKAARRQIMRKAKAAMGLTGVRGVTTDYGDGFEFRPYRSCTIMFITYKETT